MTTPQARTNETGRTQRPLTVVLELCLYRVVSDQCEGRILPFGVRQLIHNYAFVQFDNDTLREAVNLWFSDQQGAEVEYGPIGEWNITRVTDTSNLFNDRQTFNADISRWNVRIVTNMSGIFDGASSFNQPLNSWNVSNVSTMYAMFDGASSFSGCSWYR